MDLLHRYILLYVFLMLLSTGCLWGQDEAKPLRRFDYGLTFASHTANQDSRTGLDLTPDKPLKISDHEFTLKFTLKLHQEEHTYGYIVRVVAGESSSFDIISHLSRKSIKLVLHSAGKPMRMRSIEFDNDIEIDSISGMWHDVEIRFLRDRIVTSIDEFSVEIDEALDGFDNLRVMFGRNTHHNFSTTDVPPMSLRDVEIVNANGITIRKWALSYHAIDEVYDSLKSSRATVENGIWELDKHSQWKKIKTIEFDTLGAQVTYDDITPRVFVALDKAVYTYNAEEDRLMHVKSVQGTPYVGVSRQIIYDRMADKLVSFTLEIDKLSVYDFKTNGWSTNHGSPIDRYQHQNHFIDHNRGELITFGGYGRHTYLSNLSKISLLNDGAWQSRKIEEIAPRYLSAMGVESDSTVLIMGGYGSFSGRQEDSPRTFYDLHRLNYHTNESQRIWEQTELEGHYAHSNSMIVDSESQRLYALSYRNDRYKTHLFLSSFDLERNSLTRSVIGDSIAYNFLDIKSYSDIFLDKARSTLYALVLQDEGSSQTLEIYSLAYPPVLSTIPKVEKAPNNRTFTWALLGVVILLALYALYKPKYRRGDSASVPAQQSKAHEVRTTVRSSISLIGGLQVIDSNGESITQEFTPTLKQVFIFLLLNSVAGAKGAPSQLLDDTFWYDMEREKAQNNRSVNIHRLRLLVEKIGEVDIVHKSSYWHMVIGEDVACDYRDLMALIGSQRGKRQYNEEEIYRIFELASGALLPHSQHEWLESYKTNYSIAVTEALLRISRQPDVVNKPRVLLDTANAMLANDSGDEDAVKMKVGALYMLGQRGLSKKTYDTFRIEYEKLLGTPPDFTYEEIIK